MAKGATKVAGLGISTVVAFAVGIVLWEIFDYKIWTLPGRTLRGDAGTVLARTRVTS